MVRALGLKLSGPGFKSSGSPWLRAGEGLERAGEEGNLPGGEMFVNVSF